MIRVALADDQALLRHGLAALLGMNPEIEVVGEADTCHGTLAMVRESDPDVLLLDVQMPVGGAPSPGTSGRGNGHGHETAREVADGLDVARILASAPRTPGQAPRPRILVLTTFGRPGYLRRTLEAGAQGFMVKDAPVDTLIDAIRRVHQGLTVVDPDLAAQSLAAGECPLTAKEIEVLRAARGGGTSEEIAGRLFLAPGTVRNHISSALGKLHVSSRADAVRVADEHGWL